MTKDEYAKKALELIQKPVSDRILGYKNKYGQVIRYDVDNLDFVKGHPQQGIATMMKTDLKYFERHKLLEGTK